HHAGRLRLPMHYDVPHLAAASMLRARELKREQHRQSDQSERRCQALGASGIGSHAGNSVTSIWLLLVSHRVVTAEAAFTTCPQQTSALFPAPCYIQYNRSNVRPYIHSGRSSNAVASFRILAARFDRCEEAD